MWDDFEPHLPEEKICVFMNKDSGKWSTLTCSANIVAESLICQKKRGMYNFKISYSLIANDDMQKKNPILILEGLTTTTSSTLSTTDTPSTSTSTSTHHETTSTSSTGKS
jgi:hypothetical protein